MGTRIVQVDAFADRPFAGNPAAVCVLTSWPKDEWLQAVAGEMNLSETAYLVRTVEGFELRWFTPAKEVDLCGHATLASSHVLWEDGHLKADQEAVFSTRSGPLSAKRHGDWIDLNFPAEAPKPVEAPEGLLEALGAKALYVGLNRLDYLIEVETENEVRELRPNFTQLEQIGTGTAIVTARASKGPYDMVSRYFAPRYGIPEDPVTGAAHCALGPYWSEKLGKSELLAYQASARGGVMRVRIPEAKAVVKPRVLLGGQAVTVLRGELIA